MARKQRIAHEAPVSGGAGVRSVTPPRTFAEPGVTPVRQDREARRKTRRARGCLQTPDFTALGRGGSCVGTPPRWVSPQSRGTGEGSIVTIGRSRRFEARSPRQTWAVALNRDATGTPFSSGVRDAGRGLSLVCGAHSACRRAQDQDENAHSWFDRSDHLEGVN